MKYQNITLEADTRPDVSLVIAWICQAQFLTMFCISFQKSFVKAVLL